MGYFTAFEEAAGARAHARTVRLALTDLLGTSALDSLSEARATHAVLLYNTTSYIALMRLMAYIFVVLR